MTDLVRDALAQEGGLLAGALRPGGEEPASNGALTAPELARLAAAGPRAAGHEGVIELAVAAAHEGYLLHYGVGRVVTSDDPDLALLAGDRLYALGLERLAALGDVEAVAELADVIGLCAQAHAAGDADLADAVWEAGAVGIGWGRTPDLEAAKASARAGGAGAADGLRAAAIGASGGRADSGSHRRARSR
jgi:hypothetical protein